MCGCSLNTVSIIYHLYKLAKILSVSVFFFVSNMPEKNIQAKALIQENKQYSTVMKESLHFTEPYPHSAVVYNISNHLNILSYF